MSQTTQTSYAGGELLAEVSGGIGRLIFNNPEKHNAVSIAMWTGLREILDEFERRADIRVVVMTGAGRTAFVSGANISQFEKTRGNAIAQRGYEDIASASRARLAAFTKPVIARIRGYCLGGGLSIALLADFRICDVDSSFGIPAARLGLGYGFDMVRTLVETVGPSHAKMLLFTGSRIDAREAARIGLVNQIVAGAELNDTVNDLAQRIAENAPLSLAAAKLAVHQAVREGIGCDQTALEAAIDRCYDSEDYREGRAAFREKRMPRFAGK